MTVVDFNWFELIPGVTSENAYVATSIAVTGLLVVVSLAARFALGSGDTAIAPADRLSLKGVFEVVVEALISFNDMVLGPEGRAFTPLFGAIFVYILASNLIGLVPGMTPPTENFNTTLSVGLFSFVIYNYYGFKEHGVGYLKQFMGPVWWLAWLMIPIELISNIVRPMSLGLRLMGNMTGDHTVLGIFLGLAPFYGIPVIFYALGLFVCFVQAFVFTLLSMVYVLMATAHDH